MIEFAPSERFTLGVELELQIIDPQSCDLTARSPEILERWRGAPQRLSPEIFQSMIEVNTRPCHDAHEVRADLTGSLRELARIGDEIGVCFAMSGTHPFAHYTERTLHPSDRYRDLIDRNQLIARRLVIFGMHVHIGMTSGDHCLRMNNRLLRYLPHLLCLSGSSPYWEGQDSGLASCRVTVFESIPTGGHPCLVRDWDGYQEMAQRLLRAGAISSLKDIWWDIRPSPTFGTLEIRMLDSMASLGEVVALTALIHVLCHALERGILASSDVPPADWWVRENKWRAARYGVEAELIQDDLGNTRPFREEMSGLLEKLDPLFREFKYDRERAELQLLLSGHSGAERQRRTFARAIPAGEPFQDLVRSLCEEFRESLRDDAEPGAPAVRPRSG